MTKIDNSNLNNNEIMFNTEEHHQTCRKVLFPINRNTKPKSNPIGHHLKKSIISDSKKEIVSNEYSLFGDNKPLVNLKIIQDYSDELLNRIINTIKRNRSISSVVYIGDNFIDFFESYGSFKYPNKEQDITICEYMLKLFINININITNCENLQRIIKSNNNKISLKFIIENNKSIANNFIVKTENLYTLSKLSSVIEALICCDKLIFDVPEWNDYFPMNLHMFHYSKKFKVFFTTIWSKDTPPKNEKSTSYSEYVAVILYLKFLAYNPTFRSN